MAAIIGGNLMLAYRLEPPFRPMSPEQQNLQHYVAMVEPRRKLVLAAVSVIALLAAGASAQGDWAIWQLYLHGGSFGQKDPQFGKDISFYAWDYPVYRLLLSFGFTAIIFSLLLVVGVNYLTGAIRLQTPGPKITLSARRHLTVLVFVFMALKALAYWLDRYALRVLQPQQVHRRVLHRRARRAAGQDDPVLDRGDAGARRAGEHVAAQRVAAGHRLRRAAGAVDPDGRHLPGDRRSRCRSTRTPATRSALHRAQHRRDAAGRTTS